MMPYMWITLLLLGAAVSYVDDVAIRLNPDLTKRARVSVVLHSGAAVFMCAGVVYTIHRM